MHSMKSPFVEQAEKSGMQWLIRFSYPILQYINYIFVELMY